MPTYLARLWLLGDLSRMIAAGLPLHHPRVVATSQRLDRVVLALMRTRHHPVRTFPGETGREAAGPPSLTSRVPLVAAT